jgi:hypothetical protein
VTGGAANSGIVNKIMAGFRKAFDGKPEGNAHGTDRQPLLTGGYGWGVDGSYYPEAKQSNR